MKIRKSIYVIAPILGILIGIEVLFIVHGVGRVLSGVSLFLIATLIRFAAHLEDSVRKDFPPDLEWFFLVFAINLLYVLVIGFALTFND